MRAKKQEIDWSRAKGLWSKMGNAELAKHLGCRYGAVSSKRTQLAKEARAAGKSTNSLGLRVRLNWDNAAWSKVDGQWDKLTDGRISALVGVPYKVVGKQRQKLIASALACGEPSEPFKSPGGSGRIDWSRAEGRWSELDNHQIASLVGVGYSAALKQRRCLIMTAKRKRESVTPFVYVRKSKFHVSNTVNGRGVAR